MIRGNPGTRNSRAATPPDLQTSWRPDASRNPELSIPERSIRDAPMGQKESRNPEVTTRNSRPAMPPEPSALDSVTFPSCPLVPRRYVTFP